MFESYIVNRERGISPQEFSDIPDGSWICSYKVDNDELWNEIINGNELNGFSLQGVFEITDAYFSKQEESFDDWIKQFFN